VEGDEGNGRKGGLQRVKKAKWKDTEALDQERYI